MSGGRTTTTATSVGAGATAVHQQQLHRLSLPHLYQSVDSRRHSDAVLPTQQQHQQLPPAQQQQQGSFSTTQWPTGAGNGGTTATSANTAFFASAADRILGNTLATPVSCGPSVGLAQGGAMTAGGATTVHQNSHYQMATPGAASVSTTGPSHALHTSNTFLGATSLLATSGAFAQSLTTEPSSSAVVMHIGTPLLAQGGLHQSAAPLKLPVGGASTGALQSYDLVGAPISARATTTTTTTAPLQLS
jgi:hypothetical protein